MLPYASASYLPLDIRFCSLSISAVETGPFGVLLTVVLTDTVTVAKPFAFANRIHNNSSFFVATLSQARY